MSVTIKLNRIEDGKAVLDVLSTESVQIFGTRVGGHQAYELAIGAHDAIEFEYIAGQISVTHHQYRQKLLISRLILLLR